MAGLSDVPQLTAVGSAAPTTTGGIDPVAQVLAFARAQGFIPESGSLPYRELIPERIVFLGVTYLRDNIKEDRFETYFRRICPTFVVAAKKGARALTLEECKAAESRPRLSWGFSHELQAATLQLISSKEKKVDAGTVCSILQRCPGIALNLRTMLSSAKAVILKWLDPVNRLRRPGYEECRAHHRAILRNLQKEVVEASNELKAINRRFQQALIDRDEDMRNYDPSWKGRGTYKENATLEIEMDLIPGFEDLE